MYVTQEYDPPRHWLQRLLYGLAAAFCLLLGIVGLVLPIIPGIVFLAIAGVLLSKTSPRFARVFSKDKFKASGRYLRASTSLPWLDRVRLGGWLAARGVINGTRALMQTVASRFK